MVGEEEQPFVCVCVGWPIISPSVRCNSYAAGGLVPANETVQQSL